MMSHDTPKAFWDHLQELHSVLLKSLYIILFAIFLTLFFYQDIFYLLSLPLHRNHKSHQAIAIQDIKRQRISNNGPSDATYILPPDGQLQSRSSKSKELAPRTYLLPPGDFLEIDLVNNQKPLFILGPTDAIVSVLKICFWFALVVTSPFWMFLILGFIAPALKKEERRLLLPFLLLSLFFINCGFLFAYYITIPLANEYLVNFNSYIGQNLWTLTLYVDYTLTLLLSTAMAFELGALSFILVHQGHLSATSLASKRRYAIVGAFIIGAILTPPDVLTQLLLAAPLIVLYECSILYAKFRA